MELVRVFENAAHQEAFERWHAYMSARGFWLGPDALLNIAKAQERSMTGEPHSGRAFSYIEYFTKAAWDKTMPPIDQFQIMEKIPSIDMMPDISMIPDVSMMPSIDWLPG